MTAPSLAAVAQATVPVTVPPWQLTFSCRRAMEAA
jgi:hypothetical protein